MPARNSAVPSHPFSQAHPFHLLQIAQVYLILFTFNTATGKVEKALP